MVELTCFSNRSAKPSLARVVTLGSASARPESALLVPTLAASSWYIGTDAAQAGVNLRCWWLPLLGGTEALWNELAGRRRGPALNDPTPAIIIDSPNPEAIRVAMAGADPRDPYTLAERQAIHTEQANPNRELAAFLRAIGREDEARRLEHPIDPISRRDRP
jgi:hypothetical protein